MISLHIYTIQLSNITCNKIKQKKNIKVCFLLPSLPIFCAYPKHFMAILALTLLKSRLFPNSQCKIVLKNFIFSLPTYPIIFLLVARNKTFLYWPNILESLEIKVRCYCIWNRLINSSTIIWLCHSSKNFYQPLSTTLSLQH